MIARLTPLPFLVVAALAGSGASAEPADWDQGRSVYERRIRPAEAPERVDWDARVAALLREEPGDVVVTAVGDMIFNERITHLLAPERKNLLRILQEADVAIGNLEFSLNERPELQRVFYNFRAPRDFAWELAAVGINLVSMANNHALDFGPEGLKECLRALDFSAIAHAGAGVTLARRTSPARRGCRGRRSGRRSSPTCATGPTGTDASTRRAPASRRSTRRRSSSPAKGERSKRSRGPRSAT